MRSRLVALATIITLVSGCTQSFGLHHRQVVGRAATHHVSIAMEDAIRPALMSTVELYYAVRDDSTVVSSGTALAIAHAVKDGAPIDLIVVSDPRALSLISDELAEQPLVLGVYQGVEYWLAPVTDYGKQFVRWLHGRDGRASLRAAGIKRPTSRL